MLQTGHTQKIEKFYIDVKKLDLKSPVADISRKTKESKGNVSKILRRLLEPSDSFLQRFYNSYKIVSHETPVDEANQGSPSADDISYKYVTLLEKSLQSSEANVISLRKAVDNLDSLNERLNKIAPIVYDLKDRVEAWEANTWAIQEYLAEHFSILKQKSPESVLSALGIKSAEFRKKVEQSGTRRG